MTFKHLIYTSLFGRLFPLWMKISRWIPSDTLYLKVFYLLGMGKKLNLKKPVTYTEKLQWLKLHNTNPIYSKMVDKYQVREIISEKLGDEYLIPIYGVWEKFDEIPFENLPHQFVLKTTHDSGTVVICKDKNNFDLKAANNQLSAALSRNYFYRSREYPYKNAVPRIICEKYMFDESQAQLNDYKFFCFNGEPKILQITSYNGDEKRVTYFDTDFNLLNLSTGGYKPDKEIKRIKNYPEMVDIARKLSRNLIHIRIDLYNINNQIYFGEFTFHNNGGIVNFLPFEWNKTLGDFIKLPI